MIRPCPLERIQPTSQQVEFAVEFVDGYPRPIVQSQLLIDGVIADQKLEPPFSPLNWDLPRSFRKWNPHRSGHHPRFTGAADDFPGIAGQPEG